MEIEAKPYEYRYQGNIVRFPPPIQLGKGKQPSTLLPGFTRGQETSPNDMISKLYDVFEYLSKQHPDDIQLSKMVGSITKDIAKYNKMLVDLAGALHNCAKTIQNLETGELVADTGDANLYSSPRIQITLPFEDVKTEAYHKRQFQVENKRNDIDLSSWKIQEYISSKYYDLYTSLLRHKGFVEERVQNLYQSILGRSPNAIELENASKAIYANQTTFSDLQSYLMSLVVPEPIEGMPETNMQVDSPVTNTSSKKKKRGKSKPQKEQEDDLDALLQQFHIDNASKYPPSKRFIYEVSQSADLEKKRLEEIYNYLKNLPDNLQEVDKNKKRFYLTVKYLAGKFFELCNIASKLFTVDNKKPNGKGSLHEQVIILINAQNMRQWGGALANIRSLFNAIQKEYASSVVQIDIKKIKIPDVDANVLKYIHAHMQQPYLIIEKLDTMIPQQLEVVDILLQILERIPANGDIAEGVEQFLKAIEELIASISDKYQSLQALIGLSFNLMPDIVELRP